MLPCLLLECYCSYLPYSDRMIKKIQEALKHVEDIAQLKEDIRDSAQKISEAETYITTYTDVLKKEHTAIQQEHARLRDTSEKTIQRLHTVLHDFERELATFKTMKSQMQTNVMTQVSTDLKKELHVYITHVKEKIQELHEASDTIKDMSKHTSEILGSMQSVISLGATIKKQDFALVHYAQTLQRNDKEKLELMKKVDMLERLVAQMRRQQKR